MAREFVRSNGPKIICILKVGCDSGRTCPQRLGRFGVGVGVGSFRGYVQGTPG